MLYGSNHPNELSLIHFLKVTYRGYLPDHVLERYTDEILETGIMPDPGDDELLNRQWYLGRDPYSDSLILSRRDTVESFARFSAAKAWSTTWGQFLSLYDDHCFREAGREYESFRHFVNEQLPRDPGTTLDDLWRQYRELSPFSGRPHLDDDPYDQADHEMWLYDCNIDTPDLRQMAMEEVPLPILRRFCTVEGGGMMGGGDFVHFALDVREELVAAMTEMGFTILEDQDLINAAQNSPADNDAVFRRILENEMLDAFVSQVQEAVDERRRPPRKADPDLDDWDW
jgi:hypothetical protein